jgi:hypothetical protein
MASCEDDGRPPDAQAIANVELIQGSSVALPLPDRSVDFIVSSPPYCTRLDYAVATLPELFLLGFEYQTSLRDLRERLLGTTAIVDPRVVHSREWGTVAHNLLDAIQKHPSKASSTYYYRNYCSYFRGLFESIGELARVIKVGGRMVVVVQDSHYKEIHTDLAAVFTEMCSIHGFRADRRTDFPMRRTLAASNPGTRSYRTNIGATESVIEFFLM